MVFLAVIIILIAVMTFFGGYQLGYVASFNQATDYIKEHCGGSTDGRTISSFNFTFDEKIT